MFLEAEHYKVLKAIEQAVDEGIVLSPVLLGRREKIKDLIEEFSIEIENVEIIDPKESKQVKKREEFGLHLWKKRRRKGLTKFEGDKINERKKLFWIHDGRTWRG